MSIGTGENKESGVTLEEPEETRDIPPVSVPAKWDYQDDIVIIGGGGSGLCAAAAALRNGAKVLILEKQATTGGHSQHGGAAASFNTKAAKRARIKFNRKKAFHHSFAIQTNATLDARLIATMIDRSHEVYDWAETQSWGKRWKAMSLGNIPDQGVVRLITKGTLATAPFLFGAETMALMYPWMQWLAKHVTDNGGKILLSTKALALVKDGGRIVGVKAQTSDGKIIFAKANKAVILAAASFTNNREMIKKYCPDVYRKAVATFLPPSDTGEVTRMALGAGADLAGRDSWVAFAGGIPFYDTKYTGKSKPGPWFQYLRQGWLQLTRGGGWLEVNQNCDEFLPDFAHADYEMHPKAMAAQPGAAAYVIFDADYQTTIWKTLPPPILDDRPMQLDDPTFPWFDKFSNMAPKDWRESVKMAIDYGGIKTSDTIKGLATELQLDPAKLQNAVNKWNAKAAAGKPDEFGRLGANIVPIKKAPFYGIKTGPLIGGIFCGPRVNYKFEVVDKNGSPIPGMYAAGTCAGGTAGDNVFTATPLSSLGLAFSTGWIAGDNATATKDPYAPAGMIMESPIRLQRILNFIFRHFPGVGALIVKGGFGMSRKLKRIGPGI